MDTIIHLIYAYPVYALAGFGLLVCLGFLAFCSFEDYWSTIKYEDQIGATTKAVERGVSRATKTDGRCQQ